MQRQRTILIAEPDRALRRTWRVGLAGMGFDVMESVDGADALRTARGAEIDLLITELYLASGGERCLVRAARREAALQRLKVLVVSSHADTSDREWALDAGADAYLIKPVRIGRMLQVSSRLATSRQPSRAQTRAEAYAQAHAGTHAVGPGARGE